MNKKTKLIRIYGFAISILMLSVCTSAYATATGGLGGVIKNITGVFGPLETLMIGVSYIAGIGFVAAGIFQFKQHKDAPTQTTLGKPITMIFVGAALIWLPQIIKETGQQAGLAPSAAGGINATSLFK